MKKAMALFLSLLLALGILPALAEEPVTLTYATFSAAGAQEETLAKMIAVFEEKNPDIKIDVRLTGFNDYFTQLATQIAGGNPPDVFEMNMENFLAYMLRGATADLTGLIADRSAYSEGTLAACSKDGKLYAVPMSFSTVVMFYNKALFDQAGIAYPTDEWTWADEQAAAEKIVAAGGEDVWGIYQPITYNEFYKTAKANGGSLLNGDMTAFTLNTPENVEVLSQMIDRVRVSKVMPTTEALAGRGDWDLFTEGKLAMIHTGIWAFPTFTEKCAFDWDIVVEPGIQQKATHFFANVNCVSVDSKQKEAAARFIDAMGSDPDIVQLRLDAGWELPTIADQAMLSQYLEVTPPANRKAVFESMDYAATPPALKEQAAVAEIIDSYLKPMEMNDMSAQDALDACQKQLEEEELL